MTHMTPEAAQDEETPTRLRAFFESALYQNAILLIIIVNALVLAIGAAPETTQGWSILLEALDLAFLCVYVVEITLKVVAYGRAFFRDGWNWFDVIVIGLALLPATDGMTVLRMLRILRVLRVISVLPSLRRIVEAAIRALPGMGSILLVLVMIFIIGAVIATRMYGAEFPIYFGSLGDSLFTLFTIMTLEGWPDLARDVMSIYPNAWTFFIPFLFITSFMVLNLLVGVIVAAMQETAEEEERKLEAVEREVERAILDEIGKLREEIAALRREGPER